MLIIINVMAVHCVNGGCVDSNSVFTAVCMSSDIIVVCNAIMVNNMHRSRLVDFVLPCNCFCRRRSSMAVSLSAGSFGFSDSIRASVLAGVQQGTCLRFELRYFHQHLLLQCKGAGTWVNQRKRTLSKMVDAWNVASGDHGTAVPFEVPRSVDEGLSMHMAHTHTRTVDEPRSVSTLSLFGNYWWYAVSQKSAARCQCAPSHV